MPKWTDSRIDEKLKDELNDLSSVLSIVAQLPKHAALRILQYCLRFVTDDSGGLPPSVDEDALKTILAAELAARGRAESRTHPPTPAAQNGSGSGE